MPLPYVFSRPAAGDACEVKDGTSPFFPIRSRAGKMLSAFMGHPEQEVPQ